MGHQIVGTRWLIACPRCKKVGPALIVRDQQRRSFFLYGCGHWSPLSEAMTPYEP